jgi:hypothetical protein
MEVATFGDSIGVIYDTLSSHSLYLPLLLPLNW